MMWVALATRFCPRLATSDPYPGSDENPGPLNGSKSRRSAKLYRAIRSNAVPNAVSLRTSKWSVRSRCVGDVT